jgi:hypothetical protein
MHAQTWKLATVIGLLTALGVAAAMTIMDWRRNPGGIFHNELGTDWIVVAETAFSWLWPVALLASLTTAIVLYAVAWLRGL